MSHLTAVPPMTLPLCVIHDPEAVHQDGLNLFPTSARYLLLILRLFTPTIMGKFPLASTVGLFLLKC